MEKSKIQLILHMHVLFEYKELFKKKIYPNIAHNYLFHISEICRNIISNIYV